ncbi:adenylyl-sulfate kinase, partial [Frankia sp. Cpl3]|nr:adenylyl-sulfate kinase [Frankia sp. Cpl3]
MANANVVWHDTTITKADRTQLNGHKSAILWFTGLSGAGKSTLANALEKQLHELGIHTYLLDGDNIRQGINRDLGFSAEDRTENIRRIGEVARLFVDAGVLVLTAFISPFQADRQLARSLVEDGEFIEIYLDCSLEACEQRDPKG